MRSYMLCSNRYPALPSSVAAQLTMGREVSMFATKSFSPVNHKMKGDKDAMKSAGVSTSPTNKQQVADKKAGGGGGSTKTKPHVINQMYMSHNFAGRGRKKASGKSTAGRTGKTASKAMASNNETKKKMAAPALVTGNLLLSCSDLLAAGKASLDTMIAVYVRIKVESEQTGKVGDGAQESKTKSNGEEYAWKSVGQTEVVPSSLAPRFNTSVPLSLLKSWDPLVRIAVFGVDQQGRDPSSQLKASDMLGKVA